jgi:hypothetical protein
LKEADADASSGAARMPSRRIVLLHALAGVAAGLAPREAVSGDDDVPRFESGR